MLYSGEISPTRCNNCVFYSQMALLHMFRVTIFKLYSWWWVRLSPETCRVKPLRIKKNNCCILLDLFHHYTFWVVTGLLSVRRGNISNSRYTGMKMRLRFQIDLIILKEISLYFNIGKTVMATVHTGRAQSEFRTIHTFWGRRCAFLRKHQTNNKITSLLLY